MRFSQSQVWYERALRVIPGGVSSPARSFKGVGGGVPIFMVRGQGAYLWDVDGNRYIDYLAAYGPGILGHAHPEIVDAIARAATRGTLFGTPTPYEVELAERLQRAIPSLEQVRFVSTGTEAVMSAVRVARAYTGRTKIIKFEGCYHGHADFALIRAGSGPSTVGQPDSAGVPQSATTEVVSLPYNDPGALAEALSVLGDQVAAVLMEPVVGNMGIVMPEPGYLEAVRDLSRQHGALLIFDEVITAFRFCFGGAQNLLGVEPDLTCLGKALGGGLTLGAYGGRQEIMEYVAPLGPTYQAGTHAGNPLSVQVALKALEILDRPGLYERLENDGRYLAENLEASARRHGLPAWAGRCGSAFTLFFAEGPVRRYEGAERSDPALFAALFREFLLRGVCLAPSRFEAWFLSVAHTRADLDETLEKGDAVFRAISG